MSTIQCKQIAIWFAAFFLFAAEATFAQNISTTAITNSTMTASMSSPSEAEEHNIALCHQVDSEYRQICREAMTKLSASSQKYQAVKVYVEGWLSTYITADTPDTVHIIHGDLTLGDVILVRADNVAIIGSDNPVLKFTSTLLIGTHSVIYSTGDKVHIEGLQIKPRGFFSYHLDKVVDHIIRIKGNRTSIKNVSIFSAEAIGKEIILSEPGKDVIGTPSLDISNINIRGDDGKSHSFILKTSGIKSINLQKIRTHYFTPDCGLFLFENASSITLNSINSHIDNQVAPNASGAIAIYTQPTPDVQLALQDVNISYKVTTSQPPVIIAAEHNISGHLSLAGDNSFDRFSIRYPAGLTVSTDPEDASSNLTRTPPSIPEYWWSDLPVCVSEPFQKHLKPTNTEDSNDNATPLPSIMPSPLITRAATTETTNPMMNYTSASREVSSELVESSSLQAMRNFTLRELTSSSAVESNSINSSSAGITSISGTSTSASSKTPKKNSKKLDTNTATSETTNTIESSLVTKSSSAYSPSTHYGIETTSPPAAENRDFEESDSHSLAYLSAIAIPVAAAAAYAAAIGGCWKSKRKGVCNVMKYMLFKIPEYKEWPSWYMSIMADESPSVELQDVTSDKSFLIPYP